MEWRKQWWKRWPDGERRERELDAELRDHLERLTNRHVADGLPQDEARRRAVLEFGGLEQVKDACREARASHLLDETRQDVRIAVRSLRRQRGFTLAVVCTLALGLGASAAIFAIVNAILIRPLPYLDAERLVQVVETIPAAESATGLVQRTTTMNMSEFVEWRTRGATVSHAAARHPVAMTFMSREGAVRLTGTRVSPAIFAMLGVPPVVGRPLQGGDEQSGSQNVILLGHAAWQTYFGGDPQVVGRPVALDGVAYSVVGVMPRGFRMFPDPPAAFWIPLVVAAESGQFQRLDVIARLADGASIDEAASEAQTLFRAFRGYEAGDAGPHVEVVSWQRELVAPIRPALLVFAGAVSLVLMIACLNVINLFLARSTARQDELAVRIALGAGRGRLLRQFLAEGLLLTMASAAAALAVAMTTLRFLRVTGEALPRSDLARLDVAGSTIPRLNEIAIDTSVVLYTVVLALAIGAFFAITPALVASRTQWIAAGALPASPSRWSRSRNCAVLCQVSLTVVLLTGAGLLIRSFVELTQVDVGYDASDVLTFQTVPGAFGPAAQDERARRFLEDLLARLAGIPGVQSAAFTSALPMVQGKFLLNLRPTPGSPRPSIPGGIAFVVSRGYFELLRVPLLAGRTFSADDRAGRTRAFVINRTLAAQYFGNVDPLGKPMTPWGLPGEVVGVVADIRQGSLAAAPEPQLFMDVRQLPAGWPFGYSDGVYVAIRTEADAGAIVPAIRRAVRELEPTMPVDSIATMDAIVSNSVTRPRTDAALMGVFAGVALLLAAVGVYGVVAYVVTQRTREIGIRIALGARRREVFALVMRGAIALTATALVVGLAGAAGATRYLEGMLYGITPLDPATFVGVIATLGVVALVAAWVPARRAAGVDPLVALRYE